MTGEQRISLSSGITLNVAVAGDVEAPAVIMLHGFPESHRTWRRLAPLLSESLRLVMPDQRGFGASDRPQSVSEYSIEKLVADVFSLAEALSIPSFHLVGHDWGGAVAWAAALRGDCRLGRLGIINSPHPLLFQKSLVENEDQRRASQYIRAFRSPLMEPAIEKMGLEEFFEKSFATHVDLKIIADEERARYISDWSRPGALTSMLNWYRASELVVPIPGEHAELPNWVTRPFPVVQNPALMVWGMRDSALLPVQLEGLGNLVADLAIERIADAGHFVPWEKPKTVAGVLKPFLAGPQRA